MFRYINERYCFQMDFPDGWGKSSGFDRLPVIAANVIKDADIEEEFVNKNLERLNIVVQAMQPELTPDITEMLAETNALENNFTGFESGRIEIAGRSHTCATYLVGRAWSKKYLIVLNGYGYALTCCLPLERKSQEVEDGWDRIAASLRLTVPMDPAVVRFNQSLEAARMLTIIRREFWMQRERARHKAGW